MQEKASNGKPTTPMLFPYDPEQFWQQMRQLVKEEINLQTENLKRPASTSYETPGMTYKPLYKIAEICDIFHVTKPTIYDWIKHGKLKPFKIRSRVFFLWNDIQQLLQPQSKQ